MLDELRTFLAVVEHKNFTKAAESVNLSQPSVSLHVKRLEEYFHTTLIGRSHKQKKIVVTPTGQLVYERAKHILHLVEELKSDVNSYHHVVEGSLRIGASFTIGEYCLPAFLGEFSKKYPELTLHITIDNTTGICERMKKYELDVGLVEGLVTSSHFSYEQFAKDEMVLAVPNHHSLAGRTFSLDHVQNETWISREDGSGTQEYLKLFLASNYIAPKNIITFGSNYAVKEAVANGLGITLISSDVTERAEVNGELATISLPQPYIRRLSMILLKESLPSKATEVFMEELKAYMKQKEG
ncbi:LysR family transcriptional regulator [Priestia taiwanensis]|uniref:LysR family transcriptional regulator n=1 Tax=Priestia taiwanensis TaxID=1347902 RepID=A0A917ASH2_9BACI|nr:LysR family transcriptional regulator [Priestia taiwanensis]MBM7363029.1 DNA-binding transcriptional LysR family regulator [Priestia taiwanensis]GGE67027.1 LysR family transcriptional regulator [Priestia taiwanensis]